jgi:hypothetical protein
MFSSRGPRPKDGLPVWQRIKLEVGKSLLVWCAGKCIGVETHFDKSSKPCRRQITDGALECCYCSVGWGSRWYGYIPCWDEMGLRRLAIIGELFHKQALAVAPPQCLKVTRTTAWGQPYRVEQSAALSGHPPISEADARPVDFRETLLRVWKDSELSTWCRKHKARTSDTPLSLVTPTTIITPREELLRAAADAQERGKRPQDRPAKGEPGTLAEVLKNLPHVNGKKK